MSCIVQPPRFKNYCLAIIFPPDCSRQFLSKTGYFYASACCWKQRAKRFEVRAWSIKINFAESPEGPLLNVLKYHQASLITLVELNTNLRLLCYKNSSKQDSCRDNYGIINFIFYGMSVIESKVFEYLYYSNLGVNLTGVWANVAVPRKQQVWLPKYGKIYLDACNFTDIIIFLRKIRLFSQIFKSWYSG